MRHDKKSSRVPVQPGRKPISFSKTASGSKKIENLPTSLLKKNETDIFVYKKKRPLSRHETKKPAWNLQDAQKAIFLEKMYVERQQKNVSLIIKFPDQKINESLVRGYSPNIDSVSIIQSFDPRYCYVTLKPESNVDDEIAKISKIPFQNGFLSAKIRHPLATELPPVPREIDPTTLYVGNLLPDVSVNEIKEHFSNYVRIDVGYSLKKKWRRYALIRYKNAEDAMHAFTVAYDSNIRDTSIIVRFHRIKHWKILEEVELQNEISRIKIKKEKHDAAYDDALRKADLDLANNEVQRSSDSCVTQLAPARFPIARPFVDISIVKAEPITPEHCVNNDVPMTNVNEQMEKPNNVGNNWNNHMQYFQYLQMYWQQLPPQQQQLNFQAMNQQMFPFYPQFWQQQQLPPQFNTNFGEFPAPMQNVPPPPPPPLPPSKQNAPNNNQERTEYVSPAKSSSQTAMPPSEKVDISKLPRIPKKRNLEDEQSQPAIAEQTNANRYASRRPQSTGGFRNNSTPQQNARNARRPYTTQPNNGPPYQQQRRDFGQGRNAPRGNTFGENSMDRGGRKRRR